MIYKTILLIAVLLGGQLIMPIYAQNMPGPLPPGASPFEHDFVDVKLLDSYFGYQNQKIEVQPGDQNVPFTMIFSNIGTEDITGINGFLDLPAQFSSGTSAGGVIEAENAQTAPAGSSFALTFYLNVDKSLPIHDYSGTVKLTYTIVRENGQRQIFFDFDFKLTGKSTLNVKADNPFLQPASNNAVAIKVSDPGTAPLNSVVVTLLQQNASSSSGIVIDQNRWDVGNVQPNSANTFSLNAFIPQSMAGQTLHPQFSITYFDGQGNQITTSRTVDFIVGPSTMSSIEISSPSYIMMGVMQNMTLKIENLTPSKMTNIGITITPNSNGLQILKDNKWFIQEIDPLDSTNLYIPVFADSSIQDQAVSYDVNLQYTKDGATIIEKQSFSTYIRPVIDISIYGVQVQEIAGQKMIIGNVLNQGNIKAQFGQVTIDPLESSTIKESSQYMGDLDIDAPTPFNVPATSTTGAILGDQKILVTLTYKDSLLQPHTITQIDTVSFGTPVILQSNVVSSQLQLVILVAIAAGVGGIVFKVKKKKIPLEKKIQESS